MKKTHTENTVGPWAQQKLNALQSYLEAYMNVMKNQRFRLVFLDAFAGAGISRVRTSVAEDNDYPLLEEEDADAQELFIEGSPIRALGLERPFHHYRFVDMDPARALRLEALHAEFPDREIKVLNKEANQAVQEIAEKFGAWDLRGVAFLDPYGAHLHWRTLEALAGTGKFDVIINFPLDMAINRLITRDGAPPARWQQQLDLCFGTTEWRAAAYIESDGLFGPQTEKRADAAARLLDLYVGRLDQLFGNVSRPSLVRNTRGVGLYHLIWAASNPHGKKIANHILDLGERVTKPTRL